MITHPCPREDRRIQRMTNGLQTDLLLAGQLAWDPWERLCIQENKVREARAAVSENLGKTERRVADSPTRREKAL